MSFRTYHQVQGDDRSALGAQVAAQFARVRERLRDVQRVVAVMSGKGGVGKSWVVAAIAAAAARRAGLRIGVLDADLKSPTVARMLGARGPLRLDVDGVHPATGRDGVAVMSTDLLLDEGDPLAWHEPGVARFAWRSTLEAGALREFVSDVVWGSLAVLLVDLPPDSDRIADLVELIPQLAGALVVTLPTEESRRSVERSMRAAVHARVPILGVIENMSGYACESCRATRPLFRGDAGAALAAEFGVPLLARIPFCAAEASSCVDDSAEAGILAAVLASGPRTASPGHEAPMAGSP